MVVEVFSAIMVKLFDSKASPIQRNLLFMGIIFIFLFIIATVATLETFLRIALGNKISKGAQDITTVFLAPTNQKFALIQRDVQNQYLEVIRNFEEQPLLNGIKEKIIASQQGFLSSLVELYKTDSRYVYSLTIALIIGGITLAVKAELIANPLTEIRDNMLISYYSKWNDCIEGEEVAKTSQQMIREYLEKTGEHADGAVVQALSMMVETAQGSGLFNKLPLTEIIKGYKASEGSLQQNNYYLIPPVYYKHGSDSGEIYLNFTSQTVGKIEEEIQPVMQIVRKDITDNLSNADEMLHLKEVRNLTHREAEREIANLDTLVADLEEDEIFGKRIKEYKDTLKLRDKDRAEYVTAAKVLNETQGKVKGAKVNHVFIDEQASEKVAEMEAVLITLKGKVTNSTIQTALLASQLSEELKNY